MRSIVVLADDTWETVWEDAPYVMEITEPEYDDLIEEINDPSGLEKNKRVALSDLIECWNKQYPLRRLPTMHDPKIAALRLMLSPEADRELIKVSKGDRNLFEVGSDEYMVVTDEEATRLARERVRETLWGCSTSFLASYVPALSDPKVAQAWNLMTSKLCESVNDLVIALVGDKLDDLIDGVIQADGRGASLSPYDGNEERIHLNGTTYYIYRVN